MERGRNGQTKYPACTCHVERVSEAHECGLVWPGRQRTAQHVEPGKDSEVLMRDQKDGAPISVRGFE